METVVGISINNYNIIGLMFKHLLIENILDSNIHLYIESFPNLLCIERVTEFTFANPNS